MKRFFLLICFALSIPIWASNHEIHETTKRFTVQFYPARIDWNPHQAFTTTEAQIFTAIYEGLFNFHPANLQPVPGSAENWTISEDGVTIEFKIRENLKWSNGDPLTSIDFKASWLKLLAPATKAEYASLLDDIVGAHNYRLGLGKVEDVGLETPDERTLIVKLNQPSPQFLSILSNYSFAPVHKDFRDKKFWNNLEDVPVNGPFVISKFGKDEILLDKNPYYWDSEAVKLEGLRLVFIDNPDDVMMRFNRSEIDWVVSGMKLSELASAETLNISPQFATTYYYFSNNRKAWTDGNVRRALIMLLPLNDLRKDKLLPATSLIPSIPDYPKVDADFPLKESSREKAMELLEQAGYPEGKGLPPLVIKVPSQDEVADTMSEVWEKELGMDVTVIKTLEGEDYYTLLKNDVYDIATLSWTGDYADPYTFLGMWKSTSSFNDAGFANKEYDTLLEESAKLPHLERMKKLSEAEQILLHTAQIIPLEHFPAVNIIDLRFVDGWYPNVLDIHPFKNIASQMGYYIPGVVIR